MTKKRTPAECLKFMNDLAIQNGGKLLSTEWLGDKHKYLFELNSGEKFERRYTHFYTYGWPKSKNFLNRYLGYNKDQKALLNELATIAKKNGGKLLSKEWKGNKFKYEFHNHLGDSFLKTASAIKSNGWPKKINTLFLKEIQMIAIQRGGKCLEPFWLGSKKLHLFQDNNGIIFKCTPHNLKLGCWTPNRGLVSQPICQQALEHLFNNKFTQTQRVLTAKLLNRKRPLELDGYCEKLKIAFEYQGHPSHWEHNHKNYLLVSERDKLKKEWCKKLGIVLLVIPPFKEDKYKWDSRKVLNHIKKVIITTFKLENKKLPSLNTNNFKIKFDKINHSINQLKMLQEIALKHNGKLLSTKWQSAHHSYSFEDANGNHFQMRLNNYKTNGWPINILTYNNHSKGHKKTEIHLLQEITDIALKANLILLDKDWKGNMHLYSFENPNGEILYRTGQNIKKNGFPSDFLNNIAKKTYDINLLKKIAHKNNAKLLDNEWKGVLYFYTFETNNNIYKISARRIINKGWPKDLKKYKMYVAATTKTPEEHYQELVNFAKKYHGQVLTPKWLGNKTKHQFITQFGIIFEKAPINIKRSGWYKE